MTLTAEQHAVRATGLGGSDAAAALGISPWKTPFRLYQEKRGLVPSAPIDPEGAEWGELLEPAVATKWARVTGKRVEVLDRTLRSDLFPFMVASLDRWVPEDPAPLECKTSGFAARDQWGEEGTDEIPQHYLVQVVHYMIVTGAQWAHVAALFNGRTFRRYEVKRDRELDELVIEGERVFWRRVEEGNPPPVTTLDDVKLAFPRSTAREVEASAEIAEHLAALRCAKRDVSSAEERQAEAEIAIKAFMGDAGVLTVRGLPAITWKTSKPREGHYVKPQTVGSRVFLLK